MLSFPRLFLKKINKHCILIVFLLVWGEARVSALGLGTVLQVGRSRVRFPIMSLEFFIDFILPAALR